MKVADLLDLLHDCPLVASVQASAGSPLDDSETLLKLAQASLQQGVKVLRLEGADTIARIKSVTGVPVIGLVKRRYPDSDVYITPTIKEVHEVVSTGCEVVAVDATQRQRPEGSGLRELVAEAHAAGRLVLGDCDSLATGHHAVACGCDLVSSTLAGYTASSQATTGPDVACVTSLVEGAGIPVLAEGRYAEERHIRAALRAGAVGVVVGGALNDPVRQTARFVEVVRRVDEPVGAVDVGGTWMRFGLFGPDWKLAEKLVAPRNETNAGRLDWIADCCHRFGVRQIGVSSGGVVNPLDGRVTSSKETIPDNSGFAGLSETAGVTFRALNDGLATAWGHACLPAFVDASVLTLALGTGVGAGLTVAGRLLTDLEGGYPRVNDILLNSGLTVEQTVGGGHQGHGRADAVALGHVAELVHGLYLPDVLVLAGSVGLDPVVVETFCSALKGRCHVESSRFGEDAGLYGAAALALFPPDGVFAT